MPTLESSVYHQEVDGGHNVQIFAQCTNFCTSNLAAAPLAHHSFSPHTSSLTLCLSFQIQTVGEEAVEEACVLCTLQLVIIRSSKAFSIQILQQTASCLDLFFYLGKQPSSTEFCRFISINHACPRSSRPQWRPPGSPLIVHTSTRIEKVLIWKFYSAAIAAYLGQRPGKEKVLHFFKQIPFLLCFVSFSHKNRVFPFNVLFP